MVETTFNCNWLAGKYSPHRHIHHLRCRHKRHHQARQRHSLGVHGSALSLSTCPAHYPSPLPLPTATLLYIVGDVIDGSQRSVRRMPMLQRDIDNWTLCQMGAEPDGGGGRGKIRCRCENLQGTFQFFCNFLGVTFTEIDVVSFYIDGCCEFFFSDCSYPRSSLRKSVISTIA